MYCLINVFYQFPPVSIIRLKFPGYRYIYLPSGSYCAKSGESGTGKSSGQNSDSENIFQSTMDQQPIGLTSRPTGRASHKSNREKKSSDKDAIRTHACRAQRISSSRSPSPLCHLVPTWVSWNVKGLWRRTLAKRMWAFSLRLETSHSFCLVNLVWPNVFCFQC